ncbi:MAG TPA: hypothetical protein VKW76_02520 [Candidatus Binatia bacterium]|nr:hypothetical protein [Candidatus Binatia bacterium]
MSAKPRWMLALALLAPLPAAATTTVRARLARPPHGLQVRLTPFVVPAHHEREVCQAIALRNRRPLDVSTMEFAAPSGRGYISHHFALFVDDNDDLAGLPRGTVDSPGCVGFGQNFGAILAGVQAPRATVGFPHGVGVTFQPHQILLLNLHYINDSPRPLRVDGAINLVRAPAGSIVHHARGFQLGTFRIDVPPGENGSASAQWIAPFPMNVVLLSTHSHKHTTSVDVDLLRAGSDAGQVLQTLDYQHPTMERFTAPMRLEPGDGFHWTCSYLNDTAAPLTFGVTSENEMCFTIGSFYLDEDAAPLPAVPGCFGGDVALTCPAQ